MLPLLPWNPGDLDDPQSPTRRPREHVLGTILQERHAKSRYDVWLCKPPITLFVDGYAYGLSRVTPGEVSIARSAQLCSS